MSTPRASIRMRFHWCAMLALGAALMPAPAFAWGKSGHRVVAAIANDELSGLARAQIEQILGPGETLEEAATWPDEMRSAPGEFWQKQATPWHYVTLTGPVYGHAPPEGDAFEALQRFSRILEDPRASRADKQLALRFVIHLVGDLHQPLHAGKCCDRGGADVRVSWFGKPTNLHAVWDSQLVDDEQLSFSELARKLERHITPENVVDWWDVNPRDWIAESAKVRDTLYPATLTAKPTSADEGKSLPDLSYVYVYKFRPVMEQQLSKAGIRLAAYLNAIFAKSHQITAEPRRS